MAFQSGDRARIVEQLNLHRDQVKSTSVLAQLMTELDTFDTANGTTYADDVRALLATCETLRTTIATNSANEGIEEVDIPNAHRVEYFSGNAPTAADKNKLNANVAKIRNLLDPNGIYLGRFVLSGRVIPTV